MWSFTPTSAAILLVLRLNSLDNKTFEKILYFLNNNQITSICNLSFFLPEEYFKTELLFKILQNNDENYKLTKVNNQYQFKKIL